MPSNTSNGFTTVDLSYSSILGGTFNLGNGAGNSAEGYQYEPSNERATTTWGADGTYLHNVKAPRGAKLTLNYLANAPVLTRLTNVIAAENQAPALAGQGVISLRDRANGLSVKMIGVVISEESSPSYTEEGAQVLTYVLTAGKIEPLYQ